MSIEAVLRSAWGGYRDWSAHLINPRFVRKNAEITWNGSERPFLREPVCAVDVARMVALQAFSLQVQKDEAILQFWYRFGPDGQKLEQALLAYYALGPAEGRPEPIETEAGKGGSLPEDQEELNPETLEMVSEQDRAAATERESDFAAAGADARVVWLRVDYAPRTDPDPLHHCCHLHLGGFRDGRVPLSRVPSPRQFLEWVFAFRYPDIFRAHRLNDRSSYRDTSVSREISLPPLPVRGGTFASAVPHLLFPDGVVTHQATVGS